MITVNKTINNILNEFKGELNSDFDIYKNHVYRVFNLALLCDNDENNIEKYAIAAAFHDIAIWTHSFNYLDPSIEFAREYLKNKNKKSWINEVALMISYHHKITPYNGEFQKTVENFRKSDWVDVVRGIKLFGLKKSDYISIKKEFSNTGFHLFLIRKTIGYFIKNPFRNPLPMFKR